MNKATFKSNCIAFFLHVHARACLPQLFLLLSAVQVPAARFPRRFLLKGLGIEMKIAWRIEFHTPMAFPNRNLFLPQTITPLMPHFHVEQLFQTPLCGSPRAKLAAVPEPRLVLNPNADHIISSDARQLE